MYSHKNGFAGDEESPSMATPEYGGDQLHLTFRFTNKRNYFYWQMNLQLSICCDSDSDFVGRATVYKGVFPVHPASHTLFYQEEQTEVVKKKVRSAKHVWTIFYNGIRRY